MNNRWATINKPWQTAFELAWEAFSCGSIPIGAVITDENGQVISQGRNRIYEKNILNPQLAHAEMDALNKLDFAKYPSSTNILYTTMEPCPMCFGAIVMSRIRNVYIAARDGWCGSVHYIEKDPYIASKNIKAVFELGILEVVQLTMQTYFYLKVQPDKKDMVIDVFNKYNSISVHIAKELYNERLLDRYVADKIHFGEVFNEIVRRAV